MSHKNVSRTLFAHGGYNSLKEAENYITRPLRKFLWKLRICMSESIVVFHGKAHVLILLCVLSITGAHRHTHVCTVKLFTT